MSVADPVTREQDEPSDVPEGAAMVLMSATLFKQWVDQRQDVIVLDWGLPQRWFGDIYTPTLGARTLGPLVEEGQAA